MSAQRKIVYRQGERFWLGRLLDHPEIMSQGETVAELEQNLRNAWRELLLDDVLGTYTIKVIAV